MAKQRFVAPSVDDAIDEITSDKGLDSETIRKAIEEAVSEAYRHQYRTEMPVRTELLPTGQLRIFAAKTVVESVDDPLTEVAQKDPIANRYGLGDSVFVEVSTATIDGGARITDEFGRVAALLAKQVIRQKLREAERRRVYEEYKGREGEIVHGKVQRLRHGNVIVDLGRTEAILPRRELIPRERFIENDRVKAVIAEVRLDARGVQIVLSRRHPWLVRRLFEMEITEVYDGTVEIKSIAREAGFRTKVAVISKDSAVDPVGACVGQKGVRVQTVVRELGGEKVDIAYWHAEPTAFIREALKPATVDRVILDEVARVADVLVPDDQLSLAIGKDGQNARLAAKLTEWAINIRSAAEMAKDQAREFIQMTFGSTPAEVFASLGIGPETAPALEAAGIADLEGLATASAEKVVELFGEAAAHSVMERARLTWADLQEKAAKLVSETRVEELREVKAAPAAPFVLPNGRSAANPEELTAAMDELSGDDLKPILESEELRQWLGTTGLTPDAVAQFIGRYL